MASAAAAICALIITSCEWSSGGGVESWSGSYNWVNFSGVYRGENESYLISDYTAETAAERGTVVSGEAIGQVSGGGDSGETVKINQTFNNAGGVQADFVLKYTPIVAGSFSGSTGGFQWTSDAAGVLTLTPKGTGTINYQNGAVHIDFVGDPVYSITVQYTTYSSPSPNPSPSGTAGILKHRNITPGSVMISCGEITWRDDGQGGLSGPDGVSGSIVYDTGAWSVNLGPVMVDGKQQLFAAYEYSGIAPQPGTSGQPIYAFTIWQEGNRLQITDNNGATYEGYIGSMRSSNGTSKGDIPVAGDVVTAQFSASGRSTAGMEVTMAGTLEGIVESQASGWFLARPRIDATWIEKGGRTGNVYGISPAKEIPSTVWNYPASTTPVPTATAVAPTAVPVPTSTPKP